MFPNTRARFYKPQIFIGDETTLSIAAAEHIAMSMAAHPRDFILGTATGRSPKRLYAELRDRATSGTLKFDPNNTYFVALDEYHPNGTQYRDEMQRELWEPLGIFKGNGIVPFADTADAAVGAVCTEFEAQMKVLGRVNIQLLGIGKNGHVAFCEPGSVPEGRTSVVALTESTRMSNASVDFGGVLDAVPHFAVSKGLGTIIEAQEIVVLAFGESKADAVREVFLSTGWNATRPASILFRHSKVRWYIDPAAASKLHPNVLRETIKVA